MITNLLRRLSLIEQARGHEANAESAIAASLMQTGNLVGKHLAQIVDREVALSQFCECIAESPSLNSSEGVN